MAERTAQHVAHGYSTSVTFKTVGMAVAPSGVPVPQLIPVAALPVKEIVSATS